jgi:molybdate transport system substrate-binding protein
MADNVRVALTLVARNEAAVGIVYSTDAKVEPGVKIVGTFPADSHPAIIYPVAATTTAKPETSDYLAFLRSTTAKAIFEKYGVQVPRQFVDLMFEIVRVACDRPEILTR